MAKSKVVKKDTTAKNPDVVLRKAVGKYKKVCVIGMDKNGFLDVRASLNMSVAEIFFGMDEFKHKLLCGEYDMENINDK